jgi:hypothetical protein
MRGFAIKGIATLKEEKASISNERTFDMVCAKYYEYSIRYCLSKQDRDELQAEFTNQLGINIRELVDRISPLGFKFTFSDGGPSSTEKYLAKLGAGERAL